MPTDPPPLLGRGVVVVAGSAAPPAWAGAPKVVVDEATLASPAAAVAELHGRWGAREPVVVELGVDPSRFREPQSVALEPWSLDASFEPWHDRLHFLVWANNYDARTDDLVWWWGRKARRLGATPATGAVGDVVLHDGSPAWIDGGPRGGCHPDAQGGIAIVHREAVEAGSLTCEPTSTPASSRALAPDQQAAVDHGSGPARVVAPAGSGKTRVLTERIRHLLVDRGYEPSSVLAVAYNKRAQSELVARTADFSPRVKTLNALAYEIVGQARGRRPPVLDEVEVRRLVEQLVPRGRPMANTDRLAPYLEALTSVRLGLRDPAEVESSRDDVAGFAEAFDPFRRRLLELGAVDFDEQVYAAIEALLVDGELRRASQAGCRHVLVDELQDLTPAHVLLLRLLALPGLDVFGVGDDDQTIYSYAGADPRFLIDFSELFPGGGAHPLQVNHRCPVAVVDGARTLLGYNRRRVDKAIEAGPDADPDPDALAVIRHRSDAGAAALVEVVETWLAEGAGPGDVAVLARVASLLLAPQVALIEAGVPVVPALDARVLDRTGTRAALAYLRIGVDPDHLAGEDVVEVYRRPTRGLPGWITKWFERCRSVADVRAAAGRIDDAKVAAKVESVADDLEAVAAAARQGTTRDVLLAVRDRVGLGSAMDLLDASKGGQTASQLDDLEALVQVAALHPDPAGFEPWLRAVLARGGPGGVGDEGGDGGVGGGVTLATVHRVKGQEWGHVAVFGVSGGLLPHRLAEDVEEERRVLHVAITRGRRRVAVLADAERPSPFLAELAGTAARPATRSAVAAERPGRDRAPVEVAPVPLSSIDAGLRAALGAWRTERYRADGVPPYVVASDKVLDALAAARPSDAAGLLAIKGIGQAKVETYGEEILAVIRKAPRA